MQQNAVNANKLSIFNYLFSIKFRSYILYKNIKISINYVYL